MKKRLFWALLQGAPVRRAACIHATSDQEYAEIRNFGLCNPVAIIPNGIDLPELPHGTSSFAGGRTVLALGRIHPKKGLDLLIRAWAKLAASQSEWRLKIVGPAEAGHDEELATLADSLGAARVTIEDPVYGEAKIAALSSADLFVLSSRNENFGIAVAEALAAGTPVIATKGAPWGGLEVESCGWWIEHGVEPLAAALTQAMAMPRDALKAMGSKGRAWMARDFSWDRVASDLLAVYRWLARDEELPPVVRLV
jgi:glycosyltransferase involved in cell wall biosynthesis